MKQKGELQEVIDKSVIVPKQCKTPISSIDRTSSQKVSRDIDDLSNTTDQLDLTDILKHSTQQQNTYSFKSMWNIYDGRPYSTYMWGATRVELRKITY